MAKGNFLKHWPTMLLGLLVALVLLTAVFSFQVNQTEVAVVTTFGRPAVVSEPGLHFRWPFPFQKVYFFDKRIRCYEGSSGKLEETATSDGHNIIAGIFVNYRISDPEVFFSRLKDVTSAEDLLNTMMRSAKNSAFGQYPFSAIVNTDPSKLKLNEIRLKIKDNLTRDTADYGITIVGIGINTLGVPKTISEKVFDRMIAERKQFAEKSLAEGKSEAKKIRIEADRQKAVAIANAEAEALKIKAAGDAEAAKHYEAFAAHPALAQFLRELEALPKVLKGATFIGGPETKPFTLLQPGALNLPPVKPATDSAR